MILKEKQFEYYFYSIDYERSSTPFSHIMSKKEMDNIHIVSEQKRRYSHFNIRTEIFIAKINNYNNLRLTTILPLPRIISLHFNILINEFNKKTI